MSLAGRPSSRLNGADPFRQGPTRVFHSCGHAVDWRGSCGALHWRSFVAGMGVYACPWCGGETGTMPAPANTALVGFGDVAGVRRLQAERVSS